MTTITDHIDYRASVDAIVTAVVRPQAAEVDRAANFPRVAIDALGAAGLLGLISAREVGGTGLGLRAATETVESLATQCASTAMIMCMHYSAAAVIEAHGETDARKAVASGRALATLAFSEVGSRSQFWTPVSTARHDGEDVRLDAEKSWVTSAGEADLYVWSSQPSAAPGASTLWLVPAGEPGLEYGPAFDGLGLRGNCSRSVRGSDIRVPQRSMLGADGGGFDVMVNTVLPPFLLMSAACSVGTMEAATTEAAAHAARTRFTHLDQSLADQPTTRAYIARMRVKTDLARTLLYDAVTAAESGRADTMLRLLESKAAAGELATEVTDLAMRVCGGAAFRREVAVERRFRDARAATVMAPTTDALYELIGRITCGMPPFPGGAE